MKKERKPFEDRPIYAVAEPKAGGWGDGYASPFCGSPFDTEVFCRRLTGHGGDHSAFRHAISTPHTWPAV